MASYPSYQHIGVAPLDLGPDEDGQPRIVTKGDTFSADFDEDREGRLLQAEVIRRVGVTPVTASKRTPKKGTS